MAKVLVMSPVFITDSVYETISPGAPVSAASGGVISTPYSPITVVASERASLSVGSPCDVAVNTATSLSVGSASGGISTVTSTTALSPAPSGPTSVTAVVVQTL